LKNLPLICPGCSDQLRKQETSFLCVHKSCPHSNEENSFKLINDTPVIISEILCDTVCQVDNINSYVTRSSEKLTWLKKLVSGQSKTTIKNCERFVSRLKGSTDKPKVLVIGSGEKGSATNHLWDDPDIEIHGIDVYASETVDLVCDAHYIPLSNEYYDGVWIQAVLEHVVEPQKVVSEIFRVLKNSGFVYAETPFMQQVHEGPYDFTRYSVLGHRYLFREFSMIEIGGNKGPEIVLSWAIKYFIWSITRSQKLGQLIGLLVSLILRPFRYLVSRSSMFDASSGVYFYGYKDKNAMLSHKDLIKLYEGQVRQVLNKS
jgi:SAM-dependent methyltransferase